MQNRLIAHGATEALCASANRVKYDVVYQAIGGRSLYTDWQRYDRIGL